MILTQKSAFTLPFALEMFIPLTIAGISLIISCKLTKTVKIQQTHDQKQKDEKFWDAKIQNVLEYDTDGAKGSGKPDVNANERIIEEDVLESFAAFRPVYD